MAARLFIRQDMGIWTSNTLTRAERAVLTALKTWLDVRRTNGKVYPNMKQIADRALYCIRTCRTAINGLIEKGFLTKRRRGFGKSNEYTILDKHEAFVAEPHVKEQTTSRASEQLEREIEEPKSTLLTQIRELEGISEHTELVKCVKEIMTEVEELPTRKKGKIHGKFFKYDELKRKFASLTTEKIMAAIERTANNPTQIYDLKRLIFANLLRADELMTQKSLNASKSAYNGIAGEDSSNSFNRFKQSEIDFDEDERRFLTRHLNNID